MYGVISIDRVCVEVDSFSGDALKVRLSAMAPGRHAERSDQPDDAVELRECEQRLRVCSARADPDQSTMADSVLECRDGRLAILHVRSMARVTMTARMRPPQMAGRAMTGVREWVLEELI